jgi:hypothetical protein
MTASKTIHPVQRDKDSPGHRRKSFLFEPRIVRLGWLGTGKNAHRAR